MKRLLRKFFLSLAIAVLLLLGMVAILYSPPAQQLAKEWILDEVFQRAGYSLQVSDVSLRFPLRFTAKGVSVGQLLTFERLSARVLLRPLFQGRVVVSSFLLEDVLVHTDTLLSGVKIDAELHHLQLDDVAYSWRSDSLSLCNIELSGGTVSVVQRDVTPSNQLDGVSPRFPFSLHIEEVCMSDVGVTYTTPSMQLMVGARDMCVTNTHVDTFLYMSLQSLSLSGGYVRYLPSFHQQQLAGIWDFSNLALTIDSVCYSSAAVSAVLSACSFVESSGVCLQEGILTFEWRDGVLQLPHFCFRTEESVAEGYVRLDSGSQKIMDIDGTLFATLGPSDWKALLMAKSKYTIQSIDLFPHVPIELTADVSGSLDSLHIGKCHLSFPSVLDLQLGGTARSLIESGSRTAMFDFSVQTGNLNSIVPLLDAGLNRSLTIPDSVFCDGRFCYVPDTAHAQFALTMPYGSLSAEIGYRVSTRSYNLQVGLHSVNVHRIWEPLPLETISMQASLSGREFDPLSLRTISHAQLEVDSLQYDSLLFKNIIVQATLAECQLQATVACVDTLMHFNLSTSARYVDESWQVRLYADVKDLNLVTLGITGVDVHPAFQCNLLFHTDSLHTYSLRGRFHNIALNASQRVEFLHDLSFRVSLSSDSISLAMRSSDLRLALHSRINGYPWQWQLSDSLDKIAPSHFLSGLQAELSVGMDNPVSRYLSLIGIGYRTIRASVYEEHNLFAAHITGGGVMLKGVSVDTISLYASYAGNVLHADMHSMSLSWSTSTMHLRTSAKASFVWSGGALSDSLSGNLVLSDVFYALPAYSLQFRTTDTLSIPFAKGGFDLRNVSLYAGNSKQPLILDGHVGLLGQAPSLQLTLAAKNTDLLLARRTDGVLLYGSALVSGGVSLNGPFDGLSLTGDLSLLAGSNVHYVYKDVLITSTNSIDDVVSFVDFSHEEASLTPTKVRRYAAYGFSMNLGVVIAPMVQLEVLLGGNGMNSATLQGGGSFNLQYIPASGFRLSGRYTADSGKLNMNLPFLHVHQMSLRSRSSVVWTGSVANPMFDIVLEDRIRASVTIDGDPQSVQFLTGLSLSGSMDKLVIQFTLEAPENASMQNTLAALSPDERNKLAVALLTTGLYLGEGGTGNLMNTALMSFVQSQLDDISRGAFRTVDVSVGIDPLPDGVSGVSTRTDYTFSVAKRFWNNRIRLVVGGSVTTSNERIQSDAIIDNISVEWRLSSNGNQYVRFFYDKEYESILEGEIRETGVGYVYRRRF